MSNMAVKKQKENEAREGNTFIFLAAMHLVVLLFPLPA